MNLSNVESSAPARSLAAFVDQVSQWMPQLCQAMVRHEENHLASGHLNLPQAWALEALAEGPRTMHELSGRLRLKSSTATMFVDRLEALGYVRRRRDAEDRRTVRVELAARGRRVVQQLRVQKRAGMLMLFRPFTARERGQYLILIEKLVRGLTAEPATPASRRKK